MVKLSQSKIDFCGKERRFKRCPTKVLRDSAKGVEALQEESNEQRIKLGDVIDEFKNKRLEAEELIKKGGKKNKEKADELIKESQPLEKEIEEMTTQINEGMDEYEVKLTEAYDQVCQTLLEPMEPGEFIENHDGRDWVIAKHLGLFYDMYMSGFGQAKIDLRIRQLIDAEHEARISQFRTESKK